MTLKVDPDQWNKTLEDVTESCTGNIRKYKSVDASARFTAVNEYVVNSEGTIVRQGRSTATVTLSGRTQAADGMRLGRSPFWTEDVPEQLPSHGRNTERIEANAGNAEGAGAGADRGRVYRGQCCSRRMRRTTL